MLKPKPKVTLLRSWIARLLSGILRLVRSSTPVLQALVLVLALSASILYTRAGTPERAYAATASTLNFQARLLQSNGAIVPDGNYNIEFKLYDAATAGNNIWTETRTGANQVQVKNGYLSVYLGDVTPLPTTGWDQEHFLTMNVNGDGEMSPRLRLTAVPYAFQAQRAEELEKLIGSAIGSLLFPATLGQNTNFNLIDPGAANVDICLSTGNCAGAGGGITGSGTTNRIAAFNSSNTLTSSVLLQGVGSLTLDAGTDLIVDDGDLTVNGAIAVQDYVDFEAGATPALSGTGFGRMFFDQADNTIKVSQNGSGFFDICTTSGNCAGSGSGVTAAATTAGFIPVLTGTQQLGNSILFQDDTNTALEVAATYDLVLEGGDLVVTGGGSFTNLVTFSGGLTVDNNSNFSQTGSGTFGTGTGAVSLNGATTVTGSNTFTVGTGASVLGGTINVAGVATLQSTLAVQGASVTVGTASQTGSLIINDGNGGQTASIVPANLTQNTAFSLPDVNFATAEFCVRYATGSSNCAGLGNAVDSLNGLQGPLDLVGTANEIVVTDNNSDTITIGLPDDVTIGNDLIVTNALSSASLAVSANATIGGTLGVTGASTFTGLGTFNGGLTVVGATNINATGTAATNIGNASSTTTVLGTVGINNSGTGATTIGNSSAALTLQGSSLIINTATISRTAAGATNLDLVDAANTTLALTNSGAGVANFTVDGAITADGLITSNGGVAIANNGGFSQTGTGTFSTGTGVVSLNGSTVNVSSLSAGGLVKADVTTGALSVATAGTDYEVPITFDNGLTRTGNTVSLGGNLTSGTTIGLNGNSLTFDGSAGDIVIASTGAATFSAGITLDNNGSFTQTGTGTFSTGTGDVSLNGNTTVTGSNTFTVGTGLTTLGGGLTATGTTNINATGTAATVIGNTDATLTLNGSSVILGTASVTRTAAGTTTLDLIDGADTTLAVTNSGTGTANLTVDGSATFGTGLTVSSGGINVTGNSTITGTLSGLTGLTSSGTITFSGLSTGIVSADGSGVLSSGTLDRDSSTYFTGTLSVGNGGTGATTLTSNGILFGNGTGAVQATSSVNNAVLVTDASGNPSLSQTLPLAVQGNITQTGALDAGSITAGFGAIDVGADNISTTGTISGGVLAVSGNATVGGTLGVTGATTLGNTLTVSGLATFNGGLTVANGQQLTNAGSTLFTAITISNLATGGSIGANTATVDAATTFNVNQTTTNQTLTLPTPTDTTAGRVIYVNNIGTADFLMYGVLIENGRSQSYIWNGTAWTAAGIDSAGNGVVAIGNIDTQTKSANGAVINSGTLFLQTADDTFPGLVSTGNQTFAGAKTFNGQIIADGGINIGTDTLQGTTAIIDFTNFDVDASGNIDANGSLTIGTTNQFVVSNAGAITAATGITSSGTITFSGLGAGLVQSSSGGVLSSGAVDRNSATFFSNALSVANGGTGATTLTSNGILFGNGTSAIQATGTANDSVLITGGTGTPSLSQTLPTAVQGNITSVGTLTSGSIDSGFGTISTANNITTTATLSGGTLNVTSDATIGGDALVSGGQLTVGTATGQAGSLILYDGGSGGTQNTLTVSVASTLGQNTVITFPDPGVATAEVCYRNDNNCGFALATGDNYVQFTPNAAQLDNNAFASIYINDTGGGNLLHLQSNGTDVYIVGNNGDVTTAGDLAVNGGDITSTSSLNVTANNGALTFTSVGATSDIVLNSGRNIELQDNTNITGNLDVSGSLAIGTTNAFTINSSGAITAATGIVSSGTIQFSGLSTGIVTANGTGVIASGTLDRNSSTYFTGTLSVANGGTGATTFNTNGIVYYDGTTQVSTTAGANSVLITNGTNTPSLSQALPNAVQDNITRTGALDSGSITSGFGAIDTGADNIQTTGTVQGGIVNATTGFRINGGATTGNYLRGDGTNFISSALMASDLSGTIFNSAADTGTGTFVTGDTISVQGGTNGIDTSLTGDTFTINLDTTEIGTTTFGAGSGFTWTFDAGATDPTIAFASDALTVTAATTTLNGDLAVNGAGTFTGNLTVGTNALFVDATNNRIGIGTLSPNFELHVVGADGQSAATTIETYGGIPVFGTARANGTAASPTGLLVNDNFAQFSGEGYGSTAFSGTQAAMTFSAAENWTDIAQGTNINFYTTPTGSTTLTRQLFLQSNGNLKLGTSGNAASPFGGRVLEIESADNHAVLNLDSGPSNAAMIVLSKSGTARWHIENDANNFFTLTHTGVAQRFTINTDGNIGIGTYNASARLQVVGAATGSATTAQFNNSTSTGNILVAQDNGTAVFTIADGGNITATGTAIFTNAVTDLTTGTNQDLTVVANGTGIIDLNDTVRIGVLGTADNDAVVCRNTSGQLAGCNSTFATTSQLNSYVQFAPATAQSDTSANSSIFINDTGGGNLLQLQVSAADRFVVTNAGDVTAAGDLAVNGGDITSTTSLNVTASNGALTLVSTGAGNDVVINSADTIELQDSTNVTGALSVSNGFTVSAGGASIVGNTTIATTAGNTLNLGNATGALTVTGSSATTFVINGITISAAEFNLLDGKDAALVDVNDAVNTAITGTGALDSGSITSGFGSIDTGADNIQTTGTVQGGIVNATTGFRINGGATTGNYLRGDGTNFISSALMASDLSGTIFNSAADSGTGTFVTGDTISVQGGTNGIDTSLTGDTFTINLDTTEIGTTTFGSGSGFTWTFDAGAVDPSIAFASNALTVTAANTTLTGDLAVNGGDLTSTTNLNVTASNGALTLTSTGLTSDIILNSGRNIELQDDTNITGALSVSNGLTVSAGGASISGNTTIATTAGNTLSLGNATGALTVTGSSATTFVINGITVSASEFNLLDGKDAALVDVNDAVNTAITGTGALTSGSIGSGFGAISTGNNITTTATIQGSIVNATTGFRLNGAAATGEYLRGNGTNFVSSALLASDLSGTIFSSSGDTGTGTFVTGDTISVQGGTNGIDTVLSGDTWTLNLDTTEINDTTFGNNTDASIVWGFDPSGLTNPSFTFANDSITLTASTVTLSGDLRVNGNDIQDSAGTTRLTLGATNAITGNLSVSGNTTLGDAAGDTLTITGTSVSIPNSLNFDANTLYVDAANNRIGIGTATPGYQVDVRNGGSASQLHFSADGSDSGGYITTAAADNFFFSGGAAWTGSAWEAKATQASLLGTLSGALNFYTNTGLTPGNTYSPSLRMTITGAGNVGLNDLTPDARFEVLSTTEQMRLTHTDNTADSRFTVDASGNLTIDNTGTKTVVADDLQITGSDILDAVGTTRITLGATNAISGNLTATGNLDVEGTLTAGTSNAFVVNASGAITAVTGITSTGGYTQSGSGANTFTGATGFTSTVSVATTSSTAFRVQNTGGADTLFTVDSTARGAGGGNLIKVGNSTGTDGDVTILQVDSTTADITSNLSALNGGLYYNATSTSLKAVLNGAVDEICTVGAGNCAGSGTGVTQSGTNVNGQVAFFTGSNDISSSANFLFDGTNVDVGGSLTVGTANALVIAANGDVTTAGDLTVNGGDITSTGALNITPGGALTVGVTSQTATLQGTITTITSNGAGNDIILSSADAIELQGATNVTGSLTVSVNADIAGTLFVGTGDAFQVDANGNIVTSGDLAVNGGDITSTGALNITPGGALTVGVTGQTALMQGSTMSITSNGAGNDITLTSADQIILNATGTIELQDNTNVTGDFTVSGNSDVAGYLYVGSADQFQVDASGNTQTSGTLSVGGLATLNGGFSASRTLGADSGTTQNVGNINFATPADTTGTNTSNGLNITPTIGDATGGTNTANIINIGNTTGDAQVSLNALNIGSLTGTAANEYALNIGSGWDSILRVGGVEVINGSGQVVSSTITGTMFNTSADSGTGTVVYNDTFSIQGGTNGIDTSLSGDTFTLDLDYTEINTATFGSGTGFTWTYDVGAVDPQIGFASDEITLTVGSTVMTGDLAVNGGDITSTGALNITPGGALTVGVTTQTATLQGTVTTITSNGAGNDILVTSADQVIISSVGTIELQNNTNITGNLDVSGTITGGSADQFNVDASGNVTTSGDVAVNGGDITSTGALNITPGGALTIGATSQSALIQASSVVVTSNGVGSDITFTSADQILIDAGSTIELQDNTNITGNLDVTGSLAVGTADQFQISSGGAVTFAGVATDITTGANEDLTVIANGTGIIDLNDIVRIGTLATADTDSYAICRDASTGQLSACDANATGRPFLQGGNSFGATAVLGTNDTQMLQLKTDNVVRVEVQTDGDVAFDTNTLFVDAVNNRIGIGTAAPTTDLTFGAGANRTISVTSQTVADTAGNNLTLQAATGNGTGAGGSLQLTAGTGGATAGAGGEMLLQGGAAGAGSTVSGSVIVRSNGNNKTTAFVVQKSDSSAVFTVDTTNTRIIVGSGAGSVLANRNLDVAVAEITNQLHVGSATNYIQTNSSTGQLRFAGTARNSKTVSLMPEFAGAVLTGDGTNNTGTMTSDFCINRTTAPALQINVSGSNCAADESRNYYQWTAQATNDYDVWVRWQVPSDFDGWAATNPIQFYGWRSSSSAGTSVTMTIYGENGAVCGTATSIANTTTWTATNYNSSGCSTTAGSTMFIRITLSVGVNNEFARIGEIKLNYLSNF